jgi:hypothetical protein
MLFCKNIFEGGRGVGIECTPSTFTYVNLLDKSSSSFLLIQLGLSGCEVMVLILFRKCNCAFCMYEHHVYKFRIGGINCVPKCLLISRAVRSMYLSIN